MGRVGGGGKEGGWVGGGGCVINGHWSLAAMAERAAPFSVACRCADDWPPPSHFRWCGVFFFFSPAFSSFFSFFFFFFFFYPDLIAVKLMTHSPESHGRVPLPRGVTVTCCLFDGFFLFSFSWFFFF